MSSFKDKMRHEIKAGQSGKARQRSLRKKYDASENTTVMIEKKKNYEKFMAEKEIRDINDRGCLC